MDILDLILSNLKACHNNNDKLRYAYELIVGCGENEKCQGASARSRRRVANERVVQGKT